MTLNDSKPRPVTHIKTSHPAPQKTTGKKLHPSEIYARGGGLHLFR